METLYRLAVSAILALVSPNHSSSGPVVNLGYAQYQGVYLKDNNLNSYYGIRYAQAPVGDLRWKSPVPIELKNDYDPATIIDATSSGPLCIQGNPAWWTNTAYTTDGHPLVADNEDCLLLDVQVPANPVSDNLPVMVEIHGGGYTIGGTNSFPGNALVEHSQGNMIFVNIQYRLGAYGFMNSAEIREHGTANAGLLDQRAALQWVQRNIRAFGGDPSRVTIHGGSAGGGSVNYQMILFGSEEAPPFQAVIAEYPWWQPLKNNSLAEKQYRDLLQATECMDIVCLRSLGVDQLAVATQSLYQLGYKATATQYYAYGDFYFGPTVDGTIIRDFPSNEFKRGNFAKVPLMTNRETYEGLFATNTSLVTAAQVQQDLEQVFPYAKGKAAFWNRLFQVYPADAFNSSVLHRQQIYGDLIINCPTYYTSTAASDWNVPVYKMIFNAGTQLHAATRAYLFNNNTSRYSKAGSTDNTTMSTILKDWFVSFTVTHDPNAVSYSNISKPHWPLYLETPASGASNSFQVIEVNYTNIAAAVDQDPSPQCDFWHGQSSVVRN